MTKRVGWADAVDTGDPDALPDTPEYTGRGLRQLQVGPFLSGAKSTRPLGARSGVRPGTPTNTVTATSTTWTVKPHAGVLDLEAAAEAGPYTYSVDANETGSVNAADATNPRVDVVYVRLDDPAEGDGTSVPAVSFGYQAGTAAASPVAPTSWTGSARSMVLAHINVPAAGGGSPTVTWKAPRLAAAGGIIPLLDTADAAAALSLGSTDCAVYGDLGGVLVRSDGAAWTPAMRLASGTWTLAGGFSLTNNTYTVLPAVTVVEAPSTRLSNSSGAVTVLDAGVYEVDVHVRWPGTATAPLKRYIGVAVNCASINSAGALASGTLVSAEIQAPTGTADFTQHFRSRRFTAAAGDVLRVFLAQDSGTTMVINPGLNDALGFCTLAVYRVS